MSSTLFALRSSLVRPASSHFVLLRSSAPSLGRGVQRCASTFYNASLAGLTSDQEDLHDTVSAFARSELEPRASEIDRTNSNPLDLWPRMGQLGLLGMTVAEEQGGTGRGYFDHLLVMEGKFVAFITTYPLLPHDVDDRHHEEGYEVAVDINGCGLILSILINRHGTEAQKAKYLPKLIAGTQVGALAMSEPESGSDVVSMKTTAVPKGDRYILNGNKFWITNGPIASTFVIYAKTSPDQGSKGITAFIVERDIAGFSTHPKLDKVGMRGSDTCELVFDSVEVSAENVLGQVDRGAAVLMSGLDLERLVLSGGPLGLMQAAFDVAVNYVHERKQFGQPIGEFQLMQGKVADMYTKLSSARAYVYAVARACDAGQISRRDCAGAILYASDRAVEVTMEAMQCLGGNGYINDYPTGRFLRDARLYTVGAGTQEIRRMLIGREFNQDCF